MWTLRQALQALSWLTMNNLSLDYEHAPFHELGNVFIKVMGPLEKGMYVIGHSHHYDHITLVGEGSVLVETEVSRETYHARSCIDIKAQTHHKITALEDNTVCYCIHDISKLDVDDLGTPWSK